MPTTDGRHLILSRYSQPEKGLQLLLDQLKLALPPVFTKLIAESRRGLLIT